MRLLEVVAEDLVQLDELGRRARPASRRSARAARRGSPSAAPRTPRRGSAGGGSGRRPHPRAAPCPGGRAPCGRARQPAATWVSSGASACTAPRWNTWPTTEPRSSTARSSRLELVEPRREQRLDRRRDGDLAVARRLEHRDHLLDEQRVAFGGVADPLAQLVVERRLAEQRARGARRSRSPRAARAGRSSRSSLPPPQPGRALEQLGPREAEQQDRRAARQPTMYSIRSRNVGSPSGCRRTRRRAAAPRPRSRAACAAPRTSPRSTAAGLVAEQRRRSPRRPPGRARARVAGGSCLATSTSGQKVIPSP